MISTHNAAAVNSFAFLRRSYSKDTEKNHSNFAFKFIKYEMFHCLDIDEKFVDGIPFMSFLFFLSLPMHVIFG